MTENNSTCGCNSKNIGIPTQKFGLCVPNQILIDARQRKYRKQLVFHLVNIQ